MSSDGHAGPDSVRFGSIFVSERFSGIDRRTTGGSPRVVGTEKRRVDRGESNLIFIVGRGFADRANTDDSPAPRANEWRIPASPDRPDRRTIRLRMRR